MTTMPVRVAGLVLAALPVLSRIAATPFATDDYYLLADVSEPAFSPSGRARGLHRLAQRQEERQGHERHLVRAVERAASPCSSRAPPRPANRSRASARDGKSLFFLSDAGKDEETQLWRMSANGGGARQVTKIPGGISDFDLSPDGKRAVVVAEVGLHVGSKSRDSAAHRNRPLPVQAGRRGLPRRSHAAAVHRRPRHRQGAAADVRVSAITGTRPGRPTARRSPIPRRSAARPTATPTTKSSCRVSTPASRKKISTSAGPDNDPDWGARPSWSPDSRRVLWLEGGESKWIYYATRAAGRGRRRERRGHASRAHRSLVLLSEVRTGRLDRRADRTGPRHLARAHRSGERPHRIPDIRANDSAATSQSRPTDALALLESDVSTPAELFALDERASSRITTPGSRSRALGEVRDVSFASGDAEIHGYVTLPADFDPAKRYPLLAYLHGGPVYQHSHEFDLTPRLYAASGYAVLAVNPRGSSGRGFDFSRAIYADWGNLDAQDISAGITHAIDARHRGSAAHRRLRLELRRHPHRLHDRQRPADPRGDLGRRRGECARDLRRRHVRARVPVRARYALGKLRHLAEARLSVPAPGAHHARRRCSSARATTTTCPAPARSRCTWRSRCAACRRG